MSNFLNYSNRLRQFVPALSPQQSEDYVNQAWRDIRDSDDEWSFLHQTEYWLSPNLITLTGGVGVTANSKTVSLTATSIGLVAGLNNPSLTQRQIRFSPSGGPIYSIASSDVQQVTDGVTDGSTDLLVCPSGPFTAEDVGKVILVGTEATTIASYTDPTTVLLTLGLTTAETGLTISWGSSLTLDREFRESTNAAATATIARLYYSPLADVARIDCLYDPVLGYEFGYEKGTAEELNRMDPMRAASGPPYRLFFREYDSTTALPVYEMWPVPQVQRAYTVQYWARGADFANDTDSLPPIVPEELLMLRARLLAYEWQLTNEPDVRKLVSIRTMLQQMESRYSTQGQPGRPLGLLQQTKRKDHGTYRKAFIRRSRNGAIGYPIDSNYAQSHEWGPNYASPGW